MALAASAAAQGAPNQPASNPACVRLESQLAAINAGSTDPTRADQVKRAEDAVAKQQADLYAPWRRRTSRAARAKASCRCSPAWCRNAGRSTRRFQQMRGDLDRATTDLEQLKSGYRQPGQPAPRADRPTGAEQLRRAIHRRRQRGRTYGLLRQTVRRRGWRRGRRLLFSIPAATARRPAPYHTVCVRTCDGYYFPISYSTVPSRFADDERIVPAAMPRRRSRALHLSQSRRGHGRRRYRPAASSIRRCRTPSTIARSSRRPARAASPARAGATRSRTPTTSRRCEGGDIVVTDQTAKDTVAGAADAKPVKARRARRRTDAPPRRRDAGADSRMPRSRRTRCRCRQAHTCARSDRRSYRRGSRSTIRNPPRSALGCCRALDQRAVGLGQRRGRDRGTC